MSLVAINLALAGTAAPTHADEPGFAIDVTMPGGGSSWTAEWSAFADLLKARAAADAPPAAASVQTPAAAPQAPIEAPAIADAGQPAPKAMAAPGSSVAPATMKLPATGSGPRRGGGLPLLALLIAVGGVACVGAARAVRIRRGA